MKVLLRRNVGDLGKIGELVEVKPGYARNYLLPQGLAVHPTKVNVKAVEGEKQRYLEELARQKAQVEARAAVLRGKEVTIAARANVEGHLYGSVGPAQIVAALAEQNVFVEVETVALDEPIRRLDKYDVELRLGHDVTAVIHVWVVPISEGEPAAAPESAGEPPPAEHERAGDEDAGQKGE